MAIAFKNLGNKQSDVLLVNAKQATSDQVMVRVVANDHKVFSCAEIGNAKVVIDFNLNKEIKSN